jgi:nitrous oxidase accessory protein NosD
MSHTVLLRESDMRGEAVQAAIDACSAQAGGEVALPAGRWALGELRLRTGVRLRLAEHCTLEGLVTAGDVRDVAVLGAGRDVSVVTGGVSASDVRDLECSGWSGRMVRGLRLHGGRFSDLRLHQPPQRQAEGSVVWFAWCDDLWWGDCDLESNDDVFCLKRACENVTLTRSRLCGRLAAPYKIGTESDGLFRNIVFTDSVIERSDRAAISLESVDGAEIRDVRIERIRMRDVNSPLFIRLGRRDRYSKGVGEIHDILIGDIEGFGDAMDEGFGSCVTGLADRPVRNITLRNWRFVSRGGQAAELASRAVPEREELYPEFDMFGRLPAHGLYARHVRGLRLENVSWTTARPDGRPPIVVEDAEGVEALGGVSVVERPATAAAPAAPALPPGDVDALLAAVAAARAGQTVVVEPGDYAIEQAKLPIVLDRAGVVLRSRDGAERTRLRAVGARETPATTRAAGMDVAWARQIDTLLFITADGVKVRGLTLSAAVHNVYIGGAGGCEITDCRLDFSKRWHVLCWGGGRHLIARNASRAALTGSITLCDCHECELRENVFEEDPSAFRLTGACRNRIVGNRMVGVSWHSAMLERGANGNRIEGNLIADGRLSGVQVRGCQDTLIAGNEFRGQKTESVLVDQGSSGVRLRGNSFHGNRGLAVSNETEHAVDAAENWWGSPKGPGSGAEVDKNVLVEPWLRECPVKF